MVLPVPWVLMVLPSLALPDVPGKENIWSLLPAFLDSKEFYCENISMKDIHDIFGCIPISPLFRGFTIVIKKHV